LRGAKGGAKGASGHFMQPSQDPAHPAGGGAPAEFATHSQVLHTSARSNFVLRSRLTAQLRSVAAPSKSGGAEE
jgi:hypothetical protein